MTEVIVTALATPVLLKEDLSFSISTMRSWTRSLQLSQFRSLTEGTYNRRLTEENTKLGIISPIGYFKSQIENVSYDWAFVICSQSLFS